MSADLCLVTVRREQLPQVLPTLQLAQNVGRFVFLVNHACGSEFLWEPLGRGRTILGFPGAAGSIEDGIDWYVEVREQPTVIETRAQDVAKMLRSAGFRVSFVLDMESWLRRHAVFVTAVSAALYEHGCNARALAQEPTHVRDFIIGIREGWRAMDRRAIGAAPLPLRAIFQWIPLPLAARYWQRLLGSPLGEYYFARHARHAAKEMAALADDVREVIQVEPAPRLLQLYAVIDRAAAAT
jgi:2-dehydropantoate 2-reductase